MFPFDDVIMIWEQMILEHAQVIHPLFVDAMFFLLHAMH